MKFVFYILLALFTVVGCVRAPSATDRRDVLRVSVSEFVTNKTNRIIYVSMKGADAREVLSNVRSSVTFKYGDGAEWRDRRWVDKITGEDCSKLSVEVMSIDGTQATVGLLWDIASLAMEGWTYHLKWTRSGWQVVEKRIGVVA